jgi:arylsulfatase
MHMPMPGMPAAAAGVYNVYRDPREEHPLVGHSLWSGASFQDIAARHRLSIQKYPHNKLGKDTPYEGIANLRPESKETVRTFMSWRSVP